MGGTFLKGQIFRIKCENVLTYREMEIFPCEKLNLIIGANGSGKSTIIVAIILGLGGDPSIIGRAPELKEFVKRGQQRAKIEIELYHPDGNDIVRRVFDINGQSQYFVNGKLVKEDKVDRLMRKYNIQLNNLCQILPQEKLESFARMTHHERLQDTLKTVGNPELSKWLNELKNSKGIEDGLKKKIADLKLELAEKSRREQRLQEEAMSHEEKNVLQSIVKLMKQRRAWLLYYHLKEAVDKIDTIIDGRKDTCQTVVPMLKQCLGTIQSADIGTGNAQNSKDVLALVQNVKKKQNKISTMMEQISEMKEEYEQAMVKFRRDEDTIKKLKEQIVQLEGQVCDTAGVEAKLQHLDAEMQKETQAIIELKNLKERQEGEIENRNHEINAIDARLKRLNSVQNIKYEILQNRHPDIVQGMEWVNQNRNRFKGEVYGPMLMHLSVKEAHQAKFVEMCVSQRDLLAFICEYRDDTTLLVENLIERKNLKLSVVSAVSESRHLFQPKYSIDKMRKLGFHSYVLDYIDGPDIIVAYLAKNYKLHLIPVGNDYTAKQIHNLPKDILMFFTDMLKFTVKIVQETGEPIEQTNGLREARFLKINADMTAVNELEASKNQFIHETELLKRDLDQISGSLAKKNNLRDELRTMKTTLRTQAAGQGNIKKNLETKKQELKQVERNCINPAAVKKKLNLSIKLEFAKIKNEFIELRGLQDELVSGYVNYRKEKFNKDQAENANQVNVSLIAEFVKGVNEEVVLLREFEKKRKPIVKSMETFHTHALKQTRGLDPKSSRFEDKRYFFKISSSMPTLTKLINEYQAKINCLGGSDVVADYNKVKEEVRKTAAKIQSKEERFAKFAEDMQNKKEQLVAQVQLLIGTINVNFSRFFSMMECAGEVEFYRGEQGEVEDYNKYGVHIKVKFREKENLRVLDAQTQSGGERAVSVAIYLLSLQELTKVPFRCIDEINQGMDAHNERRIFNLISDSTEDQNNNTQYFLLTPKLLPDLRFPKSIKILCPYNGIGSIPHIQVPDKYIGRRSQSLSQSQGLSQ